MMDRDTERQIYREIMSRFVEANHQEARALVNRIQELTGAACARCREANEDAFRKLSEAYNMLHEDVKQHRKGHG